RFGARILSPVVPFDEAVGQAQLFGQIVSHASSGSLAGLAYHALVEGLNLAADARETIERTSATSALLLASASGENGAARRAAGGAPVAKQHPAASAPPVHREPAPAPREPAPVSRDSGNPVPRRPVEPPAGRRDPASGGGRRTPVSPMQAVPASRNHTPPFAK